MALGSHQPCLSETRYLRDLESAHVAEGLVREHNATADGLNLRSLACKLCSSCRLS